MSMAIVSSHHNLVVSNKKRGPPPDRVYITGDPNEADVVMGSKKKAFTQWPGCLRFQRILGSHRGKYLKASAKQVKSLIIKEIVQETTSNGARFLKHDSYGWYVASESAIFDKVGHTMRFKSAAKRARVSTRKPNHGSLREPDEAESISSSNSAKSIESLRSSAKDVENKDRASAPLPYPAADEDRCYSGIDVTLPVDFMSLEGGGSLLSPITVPNPLAPQSLDDETRPPLPQARKPVCLFFRPLDFQLEEETIELLLSEPILS